MMLKMVAALSLSMIGAMIGGMGIVFGDLAMLGIGVVCAAVGSLMRIVEAER